MSKRDFDKGVLDDSGLDAEAAALLDRAVGALEAKEAKQATGLDFKSAIDAHMKWKGRLSRYVEGTSAETLDAELISRDDQCVLGKWIHGAGAAAHGNDKLFAQLKEEHAHFHACAGRIVAEVQKGNDQLAQDLLDRGDYGKVSRDVTNILARLFLQSRGK